MKNKIIVTEGISKNKEYKAHFFCEESNSLEFDCPTKGLGIVLFRKNEQINISFEEDEMIELIGYLIEMKNNVVKFNNQSKKTES